MAKKVNGNSEVLFSVVKDGIPAIERPKRESRYLPVIKFLMENPNTVIELKKGTLSGLRNAIKRELPDLASKFYLAERRKNGRKHKYAVYDASGTFSIKRRRIKAD